MCVCVCVRVCVCMKCYQSSLKLYNVKEETSHMGTSGAVFTEGGWTILTVSKFGVFSPSESLESLESLELLLESLDSEPLPYDSNGSFAATVSSPLWVVMDTCEALEDREICQVVVVRLQC